MVVVVVVAGAAVMLNVMLTVVLLPALSVALVVRVLEPRGSVEAETLTLAHGATRPEVASLAVHATATFSAAV